MHCYFQGCDKHGVTKEHIPPKAFFPSDQRNQLLTVKSCKEHNNAKSKDDLYVLSHICMNASPKSRARDVFLEKVAPQLSFNQDAMRRMLGKDSQQQPDGSVKYKVDILRFGRFFSALTCGIIFKSCGKSLPTNYSLCHIYHDFVDDNETEYERQFKQAAASLYAGEPMELMKFGDAGAKNTDIYSVKIFGLPGFQGSITVVHDFFGAFRVTSMATYRWA